MQGEPGKHDLMFNCGRKRNPYVTVEQDNLADAEERCAALIKTKADYEAQIQELRERLEDEEDANAELTSSKRKIEEECDELKHDIEDLEMTLSKRSTAQGIRAELIWPCSQVLVVPVEELVSMADSAQQDPHPVCKCADQPQEIKMATLKVIETNFAKYNTTDLNTTLSSLDKLSAAWMVEREKQDYDRKCGQLEAELVDKEDTIDRVTKEKKKLEELNQYTATYLNKWSRLFRCTPWGRGTTITKGTNPQTLEDLQAEEDKVNHLNKVKVKLETTLDELEDALDEEKKIRQEVERIKKKLESDLKVAHDKIADGESKRSLLEEDISKKETAIHVLEAKFEDSQSTVSNLQRRIKELQVCAPHGDGDRVECRRCRVGDRWVILWAVAMNISDI
ncbi:Myosin N-terminal SH3-like domain [Branchiostoma belcheri]|nr:Myosin N-terminal SH3-like domain [Branchiostoma belcheri]